MQMAIAAVDFKCSKRLTLAGSVLVAEGMLQVYSFNKLSKEYMTLLAEKLQVITDEAIKAAIDQL